MSRKSELGCKIRCRDACNEFATRQSSMTPACRGISDITWAQRHHHGASECPRTSPYEFHAALPGRGARENPHGRVENIMRPSFISKTRCHPAQPHPVRENLRDPSSVVRCDEEAFRLTCDVRKLPAGLTDGRCLDPCQDFVDVGGHRSVEQVFVSLLHRGERHVPVDVARQPPEFLH
jgi:hypothetical protein